MPGNKYLVSLAISRFTILLVLSATPYAFAQPFEQVAVGASHICALDSSGQVECTTTPIATRYLPPADLPLMTQISAGQQHTCGITIQGGIQCWGTNAFGVLDAPTFDAPVTSISAGFNHNCAIDATGVTKCWGLGTNDQLDVPNLAGGFVKVDAARTASCGIDTNADIHCWSSDSFFMPDAAISGPFIDLDIDSNQACGLTANGNISCWAARGRNGLTPPAGGPYTDLAVTNSAICGLRVDQLLECSFANPPNFEIDVRSEEYPLDVPFSSIERSNQQFRGVGICAIRAENGTISCFGSSDQGFDGTLPAPPGSATPDVPISADNINLTLTAEVYGRNQVELFWNRVPNTIPAIEIEIYRDDVLLVQTANSFSYYDNDSSVLGSESRYRIRAVDANGNIGEFSNDVVIDRDSLRVITDGDIGDPLNPRLESGLQIQNFEIVSYGQFLNDNDTFILTWDIANPEGTPIAGYEIQIDNQEVGFVSSTSYVGDGFDPDVCRVYSVVAIGEDGTILDFKSLALGRSSYRCF